MSKRHPSPTRWRVPIDHSGTQRSLDLDKAAVGTVHTQRTRKREQTKSLALPAHICDGLTVQPEVTSDLCCRSLSLAVVPWDSKIDALRLWCQHPHGRHVANI